MKPTLFSLRAARAPVTLSSHRESASRLDQLTCCHNYTAVCGVLAIVVLRARSTWVDSLSRPKRLAMQVDKVAHHLGQRTRVIHNMTTVQEVGFAELLAGEIGGHSDDLRPTREASHRPPLEAAGRSDDHEHWSSNSSTRLRASLWSL